MSEKPASVDQETRAVDYEIVLVAYRSRRLVESLLARLQNGTPVVVVDNSHDADGLSEIVMARSGATYVDGPGRGFAAGANLGVQMCTRPYLLFVNPDSSPTADQLESLVADLRLDPGLVGVSAVTVLADGRVEIGVGGWEPSFPRAVVHALGLHTIFPKRGLWARPVPHRPLELDWLSGACMAVRRETFLELGGFDESYFVYNEDVEFGRAVRESGRRLALRTDLLVPHLGGGSGEARTWMAQQRAASFSQYVRRHNGRLVSLGVRTALAAGLTARSVLCSVRGKRNLALEHRFYVRGLVAGAPDAP